MGEPSGGEPLHFNLSTQIAVPAPTTEDRVAIRRLDWSRIRRNLLRCNEPQFSLSVWYSILFGFSASSFLSIAPIAVTKDLPVWVLPVYILTSLSSLFLGTVLVWLDKRLNRQRRSQIAD